MKITPRRRKAASFVALTAMLLSAMVPMTAIADEPDEVEVEEAEEPDVVEVEEEAATETHEVGDEEEVDTSEEDETNREDLAPTVVVPRKPDNVCPDTDPWEKKDGKTSTNVLDEHAELTWGLLQDGKTGEVKWDIPEGATLDLCIKGGKDAFGSADADGDSHPENSKRTEDGLTGLGSITLEDGKDVSHVSWSYTPPSSTTPDVADLALTSMCILLGEDDDLDQQIWRIENPEDFDVDVTYYEYPDGTQETMTATPGWSYFYGSSGTYKIEWGVDDSALQAGDDQTAAGPEICYREVEISKTWMNGGGSVEAPESGVVTANTDSAVVLDSGEEKPTETNEGETLFVPVNRTYDVTEIVPDGWVVDAETVGNGFSVNTWEGSFDPDTFFGEYAPAGEEGRFSGAIKTQAIQHEVINSREPNFEVEKTVSGPVDDGTEFQVCWSSADRYLGDRFDESMLSIAEVSPEMPITEPEGCVTFRYDDGTVSVVEGSASSMLEPGTYWVAEEDTGGADSVSITINPSDLERTAEDLEFPLEDDETPVAFFEVGYGDVVTVEVENSFTPVTTSTPRYFLDFDKSWTIDDLSDRVSDLETDGYNASFDVITDADGEETVEVGVDDVTLSAGGQSIAAGNDRRVSLNNDYVLEESFTALDEDLLCTIESTFSYDGEVLEANDDGEVIFTTPASASNNTTFTIDVENEIVCTAVLGEVFESIDIEAVKEWVSVGDDGEQTSIAGPADFTASFAVTVTDEDGEVMATATINDGQVEPFDEEFVDGETYTITWAEIAPPAEFENDGVTLQFNDDASTTAGSVDFVAGDDDSVTLTATNAYDPQPEDPQVDTDTTTTEVEVLGVSVTQDDEEMPKTGASALFLTVLGLLGIGLGGGMLGRFRRTES